MNKLVIFDCDGVLVDSEGLANRALVESLAEHGVELTFDEAMKRFTGRKLADCLREIEATEKIRLPETFAITFRQRMNAYFESELILIEGIEDAIQRIPYAKCVASNGPLEKIRRNLEITGLYSHFGENMFSAYTIEKWKPEPDLFLHACKTMGSEPKLSVVIEDSETGIQAARAGGFQVFAYGARETTDSNVTPFRHMSELPDLIEKFFATR